MTTPRVFLLAAAILLVGLHAPATSAKFTFGGWEGQPTYDENGRFSFCAVSAVYNSGDRLVFVLDRDGAFGVGVINDTWKIGDGIDRKLTIAIDRFAPHYATAKVFAQTSLLAAFNGADRDRLLENLRQGYGMSIFSKAGPALQYYLPGANGALARLIECVTVELKAEATSATRAYPGPAPTQAATGQAPSGLDAIRLPEGKLIVMAANVLSEAGITGYTMLDKEEMGARGLGAFSVGWLLPDGSIGALDGYDLRSFGIARDKALSDVSSMTIESSASQCGGKFMSGFHPAEGTEEVQMKRLFTACDTPNGPWHVEYLLYAIPGPILVKLANGKPVQGPGASGQRNTTAQPSDFLNVAAGTARKNEVDRGAATRSPIGEDLVVGPVVAAPPALAESPKPYTGGPPGVDVGVRSPVAGGLFVLVFGAILVVLRQAFSKRKTEKRPAVSADAQ